jgi:hypothetical protein
MSNHDVEKTLKEIRSRVRVRLQGQRQEASKDNQAPLTKRTREAELESLKANLSVIERSWNRLPPLTSYRSGWIAKLELWCKRVLKKASHWFTWEQVNFNSATSNSVRDILLVLSAHEEMLSELKSKLEKLSKAINELPPEWQQLPASDGDDFAMQTRAVEPVSQAAVNSSIAERHRLIDSEIDSLAGKIEELRARKARLD